MIGDFPAPMTWSVPRWQAASASRTSSEILAKRTERVERIGRWELFSPPVRRLAIFLLALAFVSAGDDFPPIPPLPETSFPTAAAAEPFARALLARVPPEALAKRLKDQPELIPPVLRNLGTALLTNDAALRDRLAVYVGGVARAFPARNDEELRRLAAIAVVDPVRYGGDEAFRRRMNALLPRIVAVAPPATARAILDELTTLLPLDFDTADAVATAAHLVPRASSARRVPFDRAKLAMPDDLSGPIDASFFSLSSAYFAPSEAKAFVAAVKATSPRRRIVVLGDEAMHKALGDAVTFIDDHARPFSPWPRDPFVVARARGGAVTFINRPNPQPHREADQLMVRTIVQGLPPAVDASPALMTRLGGGAGFDLDSIVTILPRANGKNDALVGDVNLGTAAIRGAAASEIASLHRAYGFRDDGDALRGAARLPRRDRAGPAARRPDRAPPPAAQPPGLAARARGARSVLSIPADVEQRRAGNARREAARRGLRVAAAVGGPRREADLRGQRLRSRSLPAAHRQRGAQRRIPLRIQSSAAAGYFAVFRYSRYSLTSFTSGVPAGASSITFSKSGFDIFFFPDSM